MILAPNGVALRNFFCGDLLERLRSGGRVVVWHDFEPTNLRYFQEQVGRGIEWVRLPKFSDGPLSRALRQARTYAQIDWQRRLDDSFYPTSRGPSSGILRRALYLLSRGLGRFFASGRGIQWLDRFHVAVAGRSASVRDFEAVIRAIRPNLLFCADQKALSSVPASLAARRAGVPTATFIVSWDNLPKARIPAPADVFLVWSDFMKRELLTLYPNVRPDRVLIVGTPQFESYRDVKLIEPREEFLTRHGLEPTRQVVCFSGDDVLTSPHDPRYLADLANALRKVPIDCRPQILFRRCPVDWTNRYDAVLKAFPEIAVSDPLWRSTGGDDWAQVVPTQEDVSLLVNVVYHSDVVVNLGSTMAMDFAVYDKPSVFVAYTPEPSNGTWSAKNVYRLPHLKSVHELQPVYWAHSSDELGPVVMRALEFPAELQDARRAWLQRHVLLPIEGASERIWRALQSAQDIRNDFSAGPKMSIAARANAAL